MKLIIHSIDLFLKDTFQTAHSKRDIQQTVIVELTENGISGYGEATANTYFGITIKDIINDINRVKHEIETYKWGSPEELYAILNQSLEKNNFSLCALDEASYDLFGKLRNTATYQYLGLNINTIPKSDFTIGIDTLDKMIEKIKTTYSPIYKIKVGTKEDVVIIKALRKHTDSVFRVDANCGWTVKETIENAKILKKLKVELIEQPLPPHHWAGMQEVYKYSVLPLIADESCLISSDVEKCSGYFHGINIKLTKCGGITNAMKMTQLARKNDMRVMIGCMTESSVGISAAAQLLPLADYGDIDGAMLIMNDPAEGVMFKKGDIVFPNEYGNGVIWKKKRDAIYCIPS